MTAATITHFDYAVVAFIIAFFVCAFIYIAYDTAKLCHKVAADGEIGPAAQARDMTAAVSGDVFVDVRVLDVRA